MNDETLFCTFYLDNMLFGIPVSQVQEVFRYQEMTGVPLAPTLVEGLINLRGQIITALDLRHQLALDKRKKDSLPMNVVVRTTEGAVSLLVDEIGDVLEVPSENYEPPPETLQGSIREMVDGVYKLKDRLLLILDTNKIVQVEPVA